MITKIKVIHWGILEKLSSSIHEVQSFYCFHSKRQHEQEREKKEKDKLRSQTRINIGECFNDWRILRDTLQLKFDAELARYLMDFIRGD